MAQDSQLTVKLVSPEGLLWEGESSFTVLPALDGELGIYPSGFLQVADDEIQVIVDRAQTPESIDADQAQKQLDTLGAKGIRDVAKHEEELRLRKQAQTRLKVASRGK